MDEKLQLTRSRGLAVPRGRSCQDDYRTRYANGEWRTSIFADMVRAELSGAFGGSAVGRETFLDIGCGHGFEGESNFQEELSTYCHQLLGVEPGASVTVCSHFDTIYRCNFEVATIPASSVDLAWSYMALEYVENPTDFFQQLYRVLKPGGVFWALTADSRHYATRMLARRRPLPLKCNSPHAIASLAASFQRLEFLELCRAGESAAHLPRITLPVMFAFDKLLGWAGAAGPFLAVRIER